MVSFLIRLAFICERNKHRHLAINHLQILDLISVFSVDFFSRIHFGRFVQPEILGLLVSTLKILSSSRVASFRLLAVGLSCKR